MPVAPDGVSGEPKKTVRCVVAEDQGLLRELLTLAIASGTRFEIIAQAEDGPSAIKICQETQPDVLITDVILPGKRGYEVVAQLRREFPDMRFLGITSHEQPHLVRQMLDAGVHGFVVKTSSWYVMIEALETVIQGEAYFCRKTQELLSGRSLAHNPSAQSLLSLREIEILRMFASGLAITHIAAQINLSEKTVRNNITRIKQKLATPHALGLVQYAIERGLVASGRLTPLPDTCTGM